MTKDQIQARIDELMKIGKQVETQIHAINGALQECNYWLEQIKQGAELETNNEG
jgi:chaperonin cofactor prefoldin